MQIPSKLFTRKSWKRSKRGKNARNRKIGIVGGSGFLGSSLAKHLSSAFDIKILDVKEPENKLNDIEFEACDIRNYSQVREALASVDVVLHLAIIQIPSINENKSLANEVNFTGTHNVCNAVDELPNIKGMILAGSWHTTGEKELNGVVDEEFGFRPDKVEDRARLYVLSKMAQEAIVRFYDEMSDKIYGVIRTGTILGEGMPEKTAANIFITRGLRSESITPYKHSMYRPMLYVDMNDVCKAYEKFVEKVVSDKFEKMGNSLLHIVNVCYSKPVTILELAKIVRGTVIKCTNGKIKPQIEITDHGEPSLFAKGDKNKIHVDITKAKELLRTETLTNPRESIVRIVKGRLARDLKGKRDF